MADQSDKKYLSDILAIAISDAPKEDRFKKVTQALQIPEYCSSNVSGNPYRTSETEEAKYMLTLHEKSLEERRAAGDSLELRVDETNSVSRETASRFPSLKSMSLAALLTIASYTGRATRTTAHYAGIVLMYGIGGNLPSFMQEYCMKKLEMKITNRPTDISICTKYTRVYDIRNLCD